MHAGGQRFDPARLHCLMKVRQVRPLTIEYLYQNPFKKLNEIVTRNKPKTLCLYEFSSLEETRLNKVKLIRAHGGCLGTRSR